MGGHVRALLRWALDDPISVHPPMLCSGLERLERLTERRYIAEPKLDGQRAQVHISEGRVIACYSRRGRDLLRHAGMAWLRDLRWPIEAAVPDGEACAGDGHEGIQAVFEERNRQGGDMSFMAFDLLAGTDHRAGIGTPASDEPTAQAQAIMEPVGW